MEVSSNYSNYVSAWFDWSAEKVVVLERDLKTGERFIKRWPAPYYFYIPAEDGEHESIFGDKLRRVDFSCREEFEAAVRRYPRRFESDISPLDRVLMDHYHGRPTPPVHFAFFDIEVNYKKELGFAGPQNPYAAINAVTVYQSWTKEFITLAIAPPGWKGALPTEKQMRDEFGFDVKPNILICQDEMELLLGFLDLIQDADIISGWNSDFFDVPYVVKRIELVLGRQALASLGYLEAPLPKERVVERFGTREITYRIFGRNHLDYLQLFQKFTFEGRTSYSLANIANEELNVPKLEHEGTLEELYHGDFSHFLLYNIRDVEILKLLDDKFKFIALVNQMAHENTVLPESILGTVKYVETGIINHAHHVLQKVVHDKVISEHEKVEGAVVLNPRIGLHEWVGSVDVNSLYPNTIRSLNISPEKIIGQFTNKLDEEDWEAIYRGDPSKRCCLILESGEQLVATAAEWKEVLKRNGWAISAYGTVFDQGSGRGVIPDILGFWYSERKRLQAEKKKWARLAKELPPGPEKDEAARNEERFDLLQLTKKISMNSAYGALLNVAFRFGDERLGASVTATGRKITAHMIETIGYLLTGERHPLIKKRVNPDVASEAATMSVEQLEELPAFPAGTPIYYTRSPAIIYGDTDSVAPSTVLNTSEGPMTIEEAFIKSPIKHEDQGRQFATGLRLRVLGYKNDRPTLLEPRAIYRHETSKRRFKVTLADGCSCVVTEDHSIMVLRGGKLVSTSPLRVGVGTDRCISIGPSAALETIGAQVSGHASRVVEVTELPAESGYAYDVIMEDSSVPYFFANGILVHNSCYYETFATSKDEAIETADLVANEVNASFPAFMREAFNCQPGFDEFIKVGREIVGVRGLFQAKKKYMIKVVDLEGVPVDKMKSMGSEIKKADTPKIIQDFLKKTVDMILDGKSYDEVAEFVNSQRVEILKNQDNVFFLGVAKQVNNLDKFYAEYLQLEKPGIRRAKLPGHVRAAINYNELLSTYDSGAKPIRAGDKVLIYYVKPNQHGIESIAFPAELLRFPRWFEDNFSVDISKTESKMFDNKLSGIFKALGKEVPTPRSVLINRLLEF